jgi:hypothetical protein
VSEVDELYGAPPEDFVARRDAMAKELRKAGDRAGADAVKKLRKPSVSAAAVNRLARESASDVEALLAAGEALRQAQLGGGERDAIRSAARVEREAVEALVGQAGKLSPSVAEEVRSTLHAAASDDETRELLRRGVLTEARQAVGLGGFGVAVPAPPASVEGAKKQAGKRGGKAAAGKGAAGKGAAARTRTAEDEAAAERERAAAERKAEAERKKAARERVKAAKAAMRDAEKAAGAAERERAAVEKTLAKADREVNAAQAEVERRRRELDEAERR